MSTTHKALTDGSEIRVSGILGRVTVHTLAATVAKYGETVEASEERDRKFKRPTKYAWTRQEAVCLTADYPGKAAELDAKRKATAAAPLVEVGDVLEIDEHRFRVVGAIGNYSDPAQLERF